jgi:glycosyltransferase involved in cell wall biosynthesis
MKPLFVISCPIDTYSGYGARSRDIVKALLKLNKYDLKIIPQRWGNTPFGFLQGDNPEHKQIIDCLWSQPQLPRQPDVWAQITVPNEFQPIGKFNIGFTAGIETTVCDPSWIEGVNRMNLTIVSSQHAKDVFIQSIFEKRDKNQGNQVVGEIKLERPVEVLFEGVDTNIYQKLDKIIDSEVGDVLDTIDEEFNYLYVGHWLQGELGQDRKDTGMLIKTFLETFKGKTKKPGLILKTSSVTYSIMDRDEILEKINKIRAAVGTDKELPNIYLLHGELEDKEMNELYNHPKVKAHVSFTKGEGYGRPLLEASISQKPVLASNYSGHLDFLNSEMSILLPGQINQIHPSAVVQNMLIPESGWFTVDYKKAAEILEDVYKNYKNYTDRAKKQSYISRTEFSLEKMGEKLSSILENKVPKPVALKLPQLKKVELPQLKKIELPKLKKVE